MSPSLTEVRVFMTEYIMTLFLILGFIGNLLNVFMFTRNEFLRNSCCLYLFAASMINLLTLNWGIIPPIYIVNHVDPSTYSLIYCKLRLYTTHTLLMIGRSLIVCACADRYALCSRSVRLRLFCSPRAAIRVIILNLFIWPLITIHIPIMQQFSDQRCFLSYPYVVIHGVYATLMAGILPPVLMSYFSILAVRHRQAIRSKFTRRISNSRRDNTLTIMLFSKVIVYVITTSLYPAITLYRALTTGNTKSVESLNIETFVNFLGGSFLIYINPASAFYVYIFASKYFRKDFRIAIVSLFRKHFGQQSRIQPQSS